MTTSSKITNFLCLIAIIILILVTFSPWDGTSFLKAHSLSFGVSGYTGGSTFQIGIGYHFPPIINLDALSHFTHVLILYPIAASLCALALFAGYRDLFGRGNLCFSLISTCALISTFIAWMFSGFIFCAVGESLENTGIDSERGLAHCFVLAAILAMYFSICTSLYGVFDCDRHMRVNTRQPFTKGRMLS